MSFRIRKVGFLFASQPDVFSKLVMRPTKVKIIRAQRVSRGLVRSVALVVVTVRLGWASLFPKEFRFTRKPYFSRSGFNAVAQARYPSSFRCSKSFLYRVRLIWPFSIEKKRLRLMWSVVSHPQVGVTSHSPLSLFIGRTRLSRENREDYNL